MHYLKNKERYEKKDYIQEKVSFLKFSIIITIYNGEKYIVECLESLLAQTYKKFELIVIDDGSTDSTWNLLQKFENHNIRIIRTENYGQGPARMTGLSFAKGKYVIFLDSDDIVEPTFLEVIDKNLMEEVDILVFQYYLFDNSVRRKIRSCKKEGAGFNCLQSTNDLVERIFQINIGWAWNKVYLRDYINRNNIFFPALRHSEDVVFVFISFLYNARILYITERLISHRILLTGSVSSSREKYPFEHFEAVRFIKSRLEKENLVKYKKTFNNWVVSFLFWHCLTIKEGQKAQLIEKTRKYLTLHSSYADMLMLGNVIKLKIMKSFWMGSFFFNAIEVIGYKRLLQIKNLIRRIYAMGEKDS